MSDSSLDEVRRRAKEGADAIRRRLNENPPALEPTGWTSALSLFLRELPSGFVLEWFPQDEGDLRVFVEVRCLAIESVIAWSPAWSIHSMYAPNIVVVPGDDPTLLMDERARWTFEDIQSLLESWVERMTGGRRDLVLRRIPKPSGVGEPLSWSNLDEDAPL